MFSLVLLSIIIGGCSVKKAPPAVDPRIKVYEEKLDRCEAERDSFKTERDALHSIFKNAGEKSRSSEVRNK